MRFFQKCWGFIIPLMLLPLVGIGLLAAGYDAAKIQIFTMLGSVVIMMTTLAYIVFLDSKKRWPGVRAFDRFARVMTFYRGK